MPLENPISLTRIGVFYDGNYFHHVSNYYNYFHARKSRISIAGLHEFVRHQIAKEEDADVRLCQIVDAHYFRGRLNAQEANQRPNQLYYDRVFDDILTGEGVTTHYLPLRSNNGVRYEKGIDVWLALEAFELSIYKKFNVLVLIASDGDYVPLIRKLNTLGIRVMVLNWDFEYTTDDGKFFATRTSQDLLEEVTYPIAMHEIIDNRISRNDPMVNSLFVPSARQQDYRPRVQQQISGEEGESEIKAIKNGYGFIHWSPQDLFFHYSSVEGIEFADLREGDPVTFTIGVNPENGNPIALNVKLKQEEEAV
jgi:cold shock CspA family protein/uncharacterized LabA/DUF88 family protein